MKAYELSGIRLRTLKLVERQQPKPGPGQVVLKMRAWSLNFRDLMIAAGTTTPS